MVYFIHMNSFSDRFNDHLCTPDALVGDDPLFDPFTASTGSRGYVDYVVGDRIPPLLANLRNGRVTQDTLKSKDHGKTMEELLRDLPETPDAAVLEKVIRETGMYTRGVLADLGMQTQPPTYEEIVTSVTGRPPRELQEYEAAFAENYTLLRDLLARAGVTDTNPKTLDSHIESWGQSQPMIEGEASKGHVQILGERSIAEMFSAFKKATASVPNLFALHDQLDPSSIEIRGVNQMRADANFVFVAGVDQKGYPTEKSLIQWNLDLPTRESYAAMVMRHEATHALEARVKQLLIHLGQLCQEAGVYPLSTSVASHAEGLAQTLSEILHGGINGVAQDLGVIPAIELVLDRLQDYARAIAALLYKRFERECPNVAWRLSMIRGLLQNACFLSPHLAGKYTKPKGFWNETPQGIGYGAGYPHGHDVFLRALASGLPTDRLLATAFHTKGYMDIHRFEEDIQQQTRPKK